MSPVFGIADRAYQLVGLALAIRIAMRHSRLNRRSRNAWVLIAAGFVLLAGQGILRQIYRGGTGFPSPADLLRLAFAPVMLAGLLMLPMPVQSRQQNRKLWLDVAVVVLASSMALWYLEVGPSVANAAEISGSVVTG